MGLQNILDMFFFPIISMPPLLAVISMALIISSLTTIIYKYTTNQSLMKQLKDEMKELQKASKELRSDPAKAMDVQKKAMEANLKNMSHSLKPTIITFIPVIIIFSWMSSHFAFNAINPGQEFSVEMLFEKGTAGNATIILPKEINLAEDDATKKISDDKIKWNLRAEKEGTYNLEFRFNGNKHKKEILVTNGKKYLQQSTKISNEKVKEIKIGYQKLVLIPLGYRNWMGWLGVYIWGSLLFTSLLRKWMKIH